MNDRKNSERGSEFHDGSPTLASQLKGFDWNWRYADRFLFRAQNKEIQLKNLLKAKGCPFSWGMLKAWAGEKILEEFEDVSGEGNFYRKNRERKGIASTHRRELITREEFEAIDAWLRSVG